MYIKILLRRNVYIFLGELLPPRTFWAHDHAHVALHVHVHAHSHASVWWHASALHAPTLSVAHRQGAQAAQAHGNSCIIFWIPFPYFKGFGMAWELVSHPMSHLCRQGTISLHGHGGSIAPTISAVAWDVKSWKEQESERLTVMSHKIEGFSQSLLPQVLSSSSWIIHACRATPANPGRCVKEISPWNLWESVGILGEAIHGSALDSTVLTWGLVLSLTKH